MATVRKALQATDYQSDDDDARQRAERAERRIAAAIAAALFAVGDMVTVEEVTALLRAGDLDALKAKFQLGDVTEAFDQLQTVYDDVARAEAEKIGYSFDRLAEQKAMADLRDGLISGINGNTAAASPDATQAQISVLTPDELADVAADLVASAGLTAMQAQAVMNYRTALRTGNSTALERVLRDRRFDPTVGRAVAGTAELSDAQVDAMVQAYARKYLKHRAQTIAGTQSMKFANLGRRAAWLQAAARGIVEKVRRFWRIEMDEKTCKVCISAVLMNPRGVGLNEPYQTIDGPLMSPADSHPSCRCTEEYSKEDEE